MQTHKPTASLLPPQHGLAAMDLFPELEREIDQKILHAEQRIKNWVMAGIITNLLVVIIAAVPSIFYLGQLSRDVSEALIQIKSNQDLVSEIQIDRANRRTALASWQSSVEAFLLQKGWHPPVARDR